MKINIIDRTKSSHIELDSETGSMRVEKPESLHGVGCEVVINGIRQIVAIFAYKGVLYFQIGNRSIDISKTGLVFKNKKIPWTFGLFRRFSAVKSNNEVVIEIIYLDRRYFHWQNYLDITYDEFDRMLDDFLLWLAKEANDASWKNELTQRWTTGIQVSK